MARFRSGVLFGEEVEEVYCHARENQYALPAINVINTSSINSVLEAARQVHSPVVVQLSNGGAAFYAGKALKNDDQKSSIAGAVSAALHVHLLAERYEVPVILHTDHASRKLLPWIDGLLEASMRHYQKNQVPLFSSHMLDLSAESLEENLQICSNYFNRMKQINVGIEIELGVTGGEEDGVDHSGIDSTKLYTQPEDVCQAFETLQKIGGNFTIAASFGNVHGVYKPGNVQLKPIILKNSQQYIQRKLGMSSQPIGFVFHGGSGSSLKEIQESLTYGVVKMNLDTDMQWAFLSGLRDYITQHIDYLKSQIGNPEGKELPNKKYYDPRIVLRSGEENFVKRCLRAFKDLNNLNRNL